MSYSLILVRVPPGASDEEVEKAARAANDDENARVPGPPYPEAELRKQALTDALLAAYPELEGGPPDYAAIARSERITEEEARQRCTWWEVVGPEDGARIQIAIYDDWVGIDMPWGGVEGDMVELWRYLEVLVREGGFVVFDPQGPNVVDVPAGPFGDGSDEVPSLRRKKRGRRRREGGRASDSTGRAESDEPPDDDTSPVSEIGRLIDRIIAEAMGEPLASAGFRRSGRTWRRHLDDGTIQVLNIQGPRRNEGSEGSFILNAGVYLPALARRLGFFPVRDAPKEYDCHVRRRPRRGGEAWTVRVPDPTEPEEKPGLFGALASWLDRRAERRILAQHERATRELRETVERHALAWLDRVSTLRGARDEFVERGPARWAVHASLELGERDEAVRILERAAARSAPKQAEELRQWGREQGLHV